MTLPTKIIFPVFLLFCFNLSSRAADFKQAISKLGLVLSVTKDYKVVAPKKNGDMEYDYAVRHTKKKYEVRYALRPITEQTKNDYKEYLKNRDKDKSRIMLDPNSLFDAEFQAVMLNITQAGTAKKPQPFNPNSVKAEYGADSGLTTFIQDMNSEFAGEYKNCLMVGIHKTDIGQVYIFHLFDNFDDIKDLTDATFYSLKFSNAKK